jgi:hypothetical protein
MNPKSSVWLDEIMRLSPEDRKQEINMMQMEIHNLELKLMIFELTEIIKRKDNFLHHIMMENAQMILEKEIG